MREEEPGSDGASGADGGADLFDLWDRPLPPVEPVAESAVPPTDLGGGWWIAFGKTPSSFPPHLTVVNSGMLPA